MPELPEVETTRRGIEPHAVGRRVVALEVHEPRLRWRIPAGLPALVAGQRVLHAKRRAKYLLLELSRARCCCTSACPVACACCPRIPRDSRTITSTSCSTPVARCVSTIRGGSGVFTTQHPTRTSTRCWPTWRRSHSTRHSTRSICGRPRGAGGSPSNSY